MANQILKKMYPRAAARVLFRQGNIEQAYSLAQSGGDQELADRLGEMRTVLATPLESLAQPPRQNSISPSISPSKKVSFPAFNQKVLQVFHSSITHDTNGYGVRSEQVVGALQSAGIQCSVMTRLGYPWDLLQHKSLNPGGLESSSENVCYHHSRNANVTLGHPESEYLRAYAEQIAERASKSGASVIHAHSNYLNGLAARIAGDQTGLPVVYEVRGLWHRTRSLKDAGYANSEHYEYCERQELEAARQANAVIAISEPLAKWLVKKGIEPSKVTVVGNAAVARTPVEKLPSDSFVIGYIGSFVEYEGLLVLLDAFQQVQQKHAHARLVMVGHGDQFNAIEKRVKEKNLGAFVDLPGKVSPGAVEGYYSKLNVAVVPRQSNFVTELIPPLKPLEIMAMGVPLIVSDVAPLASFVDAGVNGLVFNSGDTAALRDSLLYLLEQPEKGDALRNGGLEFAKQHSWEKNAQLYLSVFERASRGES